MAMPPFLGVNRPNFVDEETDCPSVDADCTLALLAPVPEGSTDSTDPGVEGGYTLFPETFPESELQIDQMRTLERFRYKTIRLISRDLEEDTSAAATAAARDSFPGQFEKLCRLEEAPKSRETVITFVQVPRDILGDKARQQQVRQEEHPSPPAPQSTRVAPRIKRRPPEGAPVPNHLYVQDDDGDTQLHVAIIQNQTEIVLQILSLPLDHRFYNIQNNLRQTPLHLTVLMDEPELTRSLLCVGARLDARDRCGNTPLHLACRDGLLQCVLELTRPLADGEVDDSMPIPRQQIPQNQDIRNYQGECGLHLAAANGHLPVVECLISGQVGADVNSRDGRSGRTILHCAVETRQVSLIKSLLRCPTLNVNVKTFDGHTALGLAYGRKNYEIFNLLVQIGGRIGDPDDISLGYESEDSMEIG